MLNAIGVVMPSQDSINERTAATLQANYLYGVESYAFPFSEVRSYMQNGSITAFRWENGEFAEVKTDFPKYIDIPFSLKNIKSNYSEEYAWLQENAVFVDEQAIDKFSLQMKMLQSELSEYSIPTFPFDAYDDLVKMINVFPQAIIKPMGGRKGAGLMTLDLVDGKIFCTTQDSQGELTEAFFNQHVIDTNKSTMFLFEPRLNILNDAGKAVDFRCLVALNGKVEWENAITYARIGGTKVASNVSAGGSLNRALVVLEELFPGQAQEKLDEINAIARKTAKFIQNCSTTPTCRLGIDICFDRNTNRAYVIEANAKPGTKLVGPWPLQLVMAQYFKYVLENGIATNN